MAPSHNDNRPANQAEGERHPHEEAMDSLGIVAGEIAHDFNNILSLIFGYVEMAMAEIPEDSRARSDLEHVLAAGDRAKELVARILTFSNQAKLKHRDVLPVEPIHQALGYIRDRLPARVNLKTDIDDRPEHLSSHHAKLYQLIVNLCSNSIQAMPEEGGEITVKLDYLDETSEFWHSRDSLKPGRYARITVADTGSGMDMATLERMYDPFFTTARGSEAGNVRAGLGLTTVHNIVDSHGGAIFVESEPGQGTTFEICLPLSETAMSPVVEETRVRSDLQGKHILLVDDEQDVTQMTEEILRQSGFQVTAFQDGQMALARFSERPHAFDLVIIDLIMPQMSGTELASEISARNQNVPIILTTGFSEGISSASCRQWGISEVINKPFSIHSLLSTISRLFP